MSPQMQPARVPRVPRNVGVVHDGRVCHLCAETIMQHHDDQIIQSYATPPPLLRDAMRRPGVHHAPSGLTNSVMAERDVVEADTMVSAFEFTDGLDRVMNGGVIVPPNPSRRLYVTEKPKPAPKEPTPYELAMREVEEIEIANGLDPKVFEDAPPRKHRLSWKFARDMLVLIFGALLLMFSNSNALMVIGGALMSLPLLLMTIRDEQERVPQPEYPKRYSSGLEQLSGPKPNIAERQTAIVQRDY